MLLRAFTVQVCLGTFFLFTPITVFLMVYVLQIPNGYRFTTKCLHLALNYGMFETFSMTYFISSYRNHVKNIFSFTTLNFCQKTKTVVHLIVSPTSI